MEYQDMIIFLDGKTNQPCKFRTKVWLEMNKTFNKTSNTETQIKFKSPMLSSSPCDYNDGYIVVKGVITITVAGPDAIA